MFLVIFGAQLRQATNGRPGRPRMRWRPRKGGSLRPPAARLPTSRAAARPARGSLRSPLRLGPRQRGPLWASRRVPLLPPPAAVLSLRRRPPPRGRGLGRRLRGRGGAGAPRTGAETARQQSLVIAVAGGAPQEVSGFAELIGEALFPRRGQKRYGVYRVDVESTRARLSELHPCFARALFITYLAKVPSKCHRFSYTPSIF